MSNQIAQFHQLALQNQTLVEQLRKASDFRSFILLTIKLGKEHGYTFTYREVELYVNRNMITLMRQFS